MLLGWGSTAGIPQLKNLKTLQVYASPVCLSDCSYVFEDHPGPSRYLLYGINFYFPQGLESLARMNRLLEVFQNEIISNTNGRIKEVKIIPRINGLIPDQSDDEEGNDGPAGIQAGSQVAIADGKQHVWVSTMDGFRKSMTAIHETLRCSGVDMEPHRVKVSRKYYPPGRNI